MRPNQCAQQCTLVSQMNNFDLLILLSKSNQGTNFRLSKRQVLNPSQWPIRTRVIDSKWLSFCLNWPFAVHRTTTAQLTAHPMV